MRDRIYAKSDGVCWYCGESLGKRWHIDHFLPLGRQPDGSAKHPERDAEDNLVPACVSCNVMKSDMDVEKFRWLIGNFTKRLNRDISVYRHAKRYGLVEESVDAEVTFWFEKNRCE